jgi:hypothetical protein
MKKYYIIIVLLLFEIGCTNSIIVKKYSKNPTQYIFNSSIENIKAVIKEIFFYTNLKVAILRANLLNV